MTLPNDPATFGDADGPPDPSPLTPAERAAVDALDPLGRVDWMLEECARREAVWGLVDAGGWVVRRMDLADGAARWVLPLWPRQELAAESAAGAEERPQRLGLEAALEELFPELERRGWAILACPLQRAGSLEEPAGFRERLAETWTEWNDEEG